MRKGLVYYNSVFCGILVENHLKEYTFSYDNNYKGPAVSLTIPVEQRVHHFRKFPAFFDGLLPEGLQLESLLRTHKLDAEDYLGQLLVVGEDLVGAVTVLPEPRMSKTNV